MRRRWYAFGGARDGFAIIRMITSRVALNDTHHGAVEERRTRRERGICLCGCDGNDLPFSSPGLLQRTRRLVQHQSSMSIFRNPATSSTPYKDETPLPDSVPKVQELGATSAPLKSAAFFIGAYCKEYNGAPLSVVCLQDHSEWVMFLLTSKHVFVGVVGKWINNYGGIGARRSEDFMLCKNEAGGDPGRCLKEGRRVTRCATDL